LVLQIVDLIILGSHFFSCFFVGRRLKKKHLWWNFAMCADYGLLLVSGVGVSLPTQSFKAHFPSCGDWFMLDTAGNLTGDNWIPGMGWRFILASIIRS
jgi:hypothetical protein